MRTLGLESRTDSDVEIVLLSFMTGVVGGVRGLVVGGGVCVDGGTLIST